MKGILAEQEQELIRESTGEEFISTLDIRLGKMGIK